MSFTERLNLMCPLRDFPLYVDDLLILSIIKVAC